MTSPAKAGRPLSARERGLLDAALAYAARGWAVFPLIGKEPAIEGGNGHHDATTDRAVVERWWSGPYRGCNIGLHCAASGLFALDVDPRNGGSVSLGSLMMDHGPLPDTLTGRTGGGGWHYLFRLPERVPRKPGAGLDIKARGYIVLPPSKHPVTGALYRWEVEAPIADAPEWLLSLGGPPQGNGDRRPIGCGSLLGDPDELAAALSLMPNDLNYEDWVRMTAAVKAGFGGAEEGYAVYERWAMQWEGNTPEICRAKWDSITDAAVGAEFVYGAARAYGFTGGVDFPALPPLEPVNAEAEAKPKRTAPVPIQLPAGFDPKALPTRPWVLGERFMRGAVTGGIGAPGVSKSTFTILSALAIATGRSDLTGEKVHVSGPVWVHNNEDDEIEMQRRIAGVCLRYGIDFENVRDRFYFSSGVATRLKVAVKDGDTVQATKAVAEIVQTMQDLGVVFLGADPLVSTHDGIDENSNEEMEKVATCYRYIATRTGAAVDLVHHTVKNHSGNSEARAGDMYAARGAGALIGAVRIAYTLSPMSEGTAEDLGLDADVAARMVRLDKAKGNYSPRSFDPIWFRMESVDLANGPDDLVDLDAPSDSVGVHVRVDLDALKPERPRSRPVDETEAETLRAIVAAVGIDNERPRSAVMPLLCAALRLQTTAVEDRTKTLADGCPREIDGVEVTVWKTGPHRTAPTILRTRQIAGERA